jgi:hypothetical protein
VNVCGEALRVPFPVPLPYSSLRLELFVRMSRISRTARVAIAAFFCVIVAQLWFQNAFTDQHAVPPPTDRFKDDVAVAKESTILASSSAVTRAHAVSKSPLPAAVPARSLVVASPAPLHPWDAGPEDGTEEAALVTKQPPWAAYTAVVPYADLPHVPRGRLVVAVTPSHSAELAHTLGSLGFLYSEVYASSGADIAAAADGSCEAVAADVQGRILPSIADAALVVCLLEPWWHCGPLLAAGKPLLVLSRYRLAPAWPPASAATAAAGIKLCPFARELREHADVVWGAPSFIDAHTWFGATHGSRRVLPLPPLADYATASAEGECRVSGNGVGSSARSAGAAAGAPATAPRSFVLEPEPSRSSTTHHSAFASVHAQALAAVNKLQRGLSLKAWPATSPTSVAQGLVKPPVSGSSPRVSRTLSVKLSASPAPGPAVPAACVLRGAAGLVLLGSALDSTLVREALALHVPVFAPAAELWAKWVVEKPSLLSDAQVLPVMATPPHTVGVAGATAVEVATALRLADIYTFKGVVVYSSFDDLVEKLATTDLKAVARKQGRHGREFRRLILRQWDTATRYFWGSVAPGNPLPPPSPLPRIDAASASAADEGSDLPAYIAAGLPPSFKASPISPISRDAVPAHDKWIVITTINEPTDQVRESPLWPLPPAACLQRLLFEQVKKLASTRSGWRVVVVGDLATPPDWSWANCVYLSPAAQHKLGYRIVARTPWNFYTRKNVGYLYAIQHGARTIYDTDDDNVILGDDVFELPECIDEANVTQATFRTINPHVFWGDTQVGVFVELCLRRAHCN